MLFFSLVNGKYGTWGDFGSCSVTCGGGTQFRERKCHNPAPQHEGRDCQGEGASKESKACSKIPCPGRLNFVRATRRERVKLLIITSS